MKYLALQVKRILRYLPFAVFMSLLLCVLVSVFAVRFIGDDLSAEDKQIVKIGMVGDTSSTFLGFGIDFIKETDSSNMMLSLEAMSESEARSMLSSGKISAYIVVPDEFVESAVRGEVMQLGFVTSDVSGGITTVFKEEILTAISQMLVHSQKGIYAMQEIALSNGLRASYSKNTDELVLRYINLVLKRPSVLRLDVSGISDGADIVTYLLCGLGILCLSLFGISYCGLFVRADNSLPRLAASRGFAVWKQTLCELASYLAALLVMTLCVLFALPLAGLISFKLSLKLLLFCVPVVTVISALQFFAFSLADNIASAVIMQFFGAIALSYVCGCIYPISFFPEILQFIGNALPLGAARRYLISAVSGNADMGSIAAIAVYSFMFIAAAIAVNYRKTLSDR